VFVVTLCPETADVDPFKTESVQNTKQNQCYLIWRGL